MSHDINTQLFERAQEMLEYWTGTMWERMIQRDIEESDFETLRYHVVEAEKEMAIQEDEELLGKVQAIVDKGEFPDAY